MGGTGFGSNLNSLRTPVLPLFLESKHCSQEENSFYDTLYLLFVFTFKVEKMAKRYSFENGDFLPSSSEAWTRQDRLPLVTVFLGLEPIYW